MISGLIDILYLRLKMWQFNQINILLCPISAEVVKTQIIPPDREVSRMNAMLYPSTFSPSNKRLRDIFIIYLSEGIFLLQQIQSLSEVCSRCTRMTAE